MLTKTKGGFMKRIFTIAIVLLFASTAMAWELQWDASTGAAGYEVAYKTLVATTPTKVDVGNVTKWAVPDTLTKGTRYEFWVRAYAGNPKSFSGDSDHLRWTYPLDVQTIEIPAAPGRLVIEFGQ
jgi:hypothetical protein